MNKKRERLEVIHDLLKRIMANNNSIKPTPLMRSSNLSSNRFAEYYSELFSKGFIREITDRQGRKYITLTDKGFKYLERYKNILDFIEEFDL